jgi:hypothetical protein
MDPLKNVWRVYISTVNPILLAVFGFSIFVLVAHDIFFAGWPELVTGVAPLWDLVYELCLAIAASFIFYLVVVHLEEQRKKEALRPFLRRYTGYLVEDAREIAQKLKEATHKPMGDFPPSSEEVSRMCREVSPCDRVPGLSWVPWHHFLSFRSNQTKRNLTSIYAARPFLDPELLRRIMDIDNSQYFRRLDVFIRNHNKHPDLGLLSDQNQLHEYLELAKRLEEYTHTHLS